MDNERKYKPLPTYESRQEVLNILENESKEDLMLLSLGVGQNFPDWKFTQDICLQLADFEEEDIRANACLGLAYIARMKGALEKHLVKPILIRELRVQTELKWRIQDAVRDINQFMGWKLGSKHLRKESES